MVGDMGHTGGLINPCPGRGQCRAGFSNTGGPPQPRKRAPYNKKKDLLSVLFCPCASSLDVLSANSLPSVPIWALVHAKVTFLAIQARFQTVFAVFSAIVKVKVLLFNA